MILNPSKVNFHSYNKSIPTAAVTLTKDFTCSMLGVPHHHSNQVKYFGNWTTAAPSIPNCTLSQACLFFRFSSTGDFCTVVASEKLFMMLLHQEDQPQAKPAFPPESLTDRGEADVSPFAMVQGTKRWTVPAPQSVRPMLRKQASSAVWHDASPLR